MSTTYAHRQTTAQKVADSKAASLFDSSSQSESLQRKADMANNATQRAEAPRPNNTGMPDNLKSGIESLSGFSMDDVRVHYNSSKPATVQALAYTQGTDIHVAPGQEKHLPHEAWHVAQQMAGRVSPTTNINGMPVNDNAALEHEADVMGEKAVQCKRIDKEKYLERRECNNNVSQCEPIKIREISDKNITTPCGIFHLDNLFSFKDQVESRVSFESPITTQGAELSLLEFQPNSDVGKPNDYISLVQIVKEGGKIKGISSSGNQGFEKKIVTEKGNSEGWAVDSDWLYHYTEDDEAEMEMVNRILSEKIPEKDPKIRLDNYMQESKTARGTDFKKNPTNYYFVNKDFRYSEMRLNKNEDVYHPETKPTKQHNGWSTVKKGDQWDGSASIRDRPCGRMSMHFKVMALLNDDTNLGVVRWGYENDGSIYFDAGEDIDTATFSATAKQWNSIRLNCHGKEYKKGASATFTDGSLISDDGETHRLFPMPTKYEKYQPKTPPTQD